MQSTRVVPRGRAQERDARSSGNPRGGEGWVVLCLHRGSSRMAVYNCPTHQIAHSKGCISLDVNHNSIKPGENKFALQETLAYKDRGKNAMVQCNCLSHEAKTVLTEKKRKHFLQNKNNTGYLKAKKASSALLI